MSELEELTKEVRHTRFSDVARRIIALETERDELKKFRDDPIDWKGLLMDNCKQCGFPQSNKEYKKLQQELKDWKHQTNNLNKNAHYCYTKLEQELQTLKDKLKTLTK